MRAPEYAITDTVVGDPNTLLSVQVENTGWSEDEAKQVFVDVIEDNRDEYPALVYLD